jgi:hypothetical protein
MRVWGSERWPQARDYIQHNVKMLLFWGLHAHPTVMQLYGEQCYLHEDLRGGQKKTIKGKKKNPLLIHAQTAQSPWSSMKAKALIYISVRTKCTTFNKGKTTLVKTLRFLSFTLPKWCRWWVRSRPTSSFWDSGAVIKPPTIKIHSCH